MRILANYGYKTNGDMYSVTFETIGDVPAAQAPQMVDELFRLAKDAIRRQLDGAGTYPKPQPGPSRVEGSATPVAISQPVPPVPAASVVVSPPATPNGNGKRPQIKDPGLPATSKQIGLLKKLARQKGRRFDEFTDLSMGEASAKIGELMAI